ncbi:hypothetical protein Tco_0943588 [Tanacetum coccineum]
MVGGKSFNTEHKLNEYKHIKPIKQKRRGLGSDRNEAACREVEELTKSGILRKVKNKTWVANTVMVKKSNKKWRMCVHFTDINKACPKDGYPLPDIDWKVESLSGFRLKCFLDTYKGYHQIQMAAKDEDKTSLFVGKEIGRNLEAYVDDMVINKTFEEDMLQDIQETFDRFRSVNMKLNPKKCSFVVEEGPFLGHSIIKQGIRADPSKVREVTDLEPPRTLKEIHSLNGKLTALSHFLTKVAKKSLPFFKALKSCTDKKTIKWTAEAEEAFRRMKELVEILPTLTTPIKGEVLVMYLAASFKSISVTGTKSGIGHSKNV